MSDMLALAPTPWMLIALSLLLLVAPSIAEPLHRRWHLPTLIVALLVALLAAPPLMAYAAIAVGALVHARSAWPTSRTGGAVLIVSAVTAISVPAMLHQGNLDAAFALSILTIALRAGVMPLHIGVSSLCDRATVVQTQQLATGMALVFAHLRFLNDADLGDSIGLLLERYGSATALIAALITIVQTDMRGFYRGTMAMHAGMLLAVLGSSALGHPGAALMVAVTVGLALGGIGMMITSLEERVGNASFSGPGGRVGAFPKLALAFAVFGFAGVAVPGTAGFIADDLVLHGLWMDNPASAIAIILSSAILAVATLVAYSRVFLGGNTPSRAPDLYPRERLVAAALVLVLIFLGLFPNVLLDPLYANVEVAQALTEK
jgi:NADH-quinone oxidoreductase subunit M